MRTILIQHLLTFANPFSIDATEEDGSYGRLINHSDRNMNIAPRLMDEKKKIYFVALRNIDPGEELLYEYGENRNSVRKSFGWFNSAGKL